MSIFFLWYFIYNGCWNETYLGIILDKGVETIKNSPIGAETGNTLTQH